MGVIISTADSLLMMDLSHSHLKIYEGEKMLEEYSSKYYKSNNMLKMRVPINKIEYIGIPRNEKETGEGIWSFITVMRLVDALTFSTITYTGVRLNFKLSIKCALPYLNDTFCRILKTTPFFYSAHFPVGSSFFFEKKRTAAAGRPVNSHIQNAEYKSVVNYYFNLSISAVFKQYRAM